MKKGFLPIVTALACFALVLPLPVRGYTPGEPYQRDLSAWIENDARREYVQLMLDYHLRTNREVQNTLAGGFSAVFLFDGCSDNMDDPVLSDLSFYRVSGVCIVLRLDEKGDVKLVYCNDNASTIPDRPLQYGAWQLPEVGKVGPATVLDGTYQLYSVYHKGSYEALHVRTDFHDGTLPAIYMTPEGFAPYRADEINVHTRTSNHTSGRGMWSAGCPLVGGGGAWEYWKLMEATYHKNYDTFEIDHFVGTLTIDRQALRREMYTLYKNPDAVDAMLENTLSIQPEAYLQSCAQEETFPAGRILRAAVDTQLMSLPCSNDTDARSVCVGNLRRGEQVTLTGSIRNSRGSLWYETSAAGSYVYAGHLKERSWLQKVWQK